MQEHVRVVYNKQTKNEINMYVTVTLVTKGGEISISEKKW